MKKFRRIDGRPGSVSRRKLIQFKLEQFKQKTE
jgi:hypothetical protein